MNPSDIEVRCPECRVSFPAGTKRCMHCGGRTGPPLLGASPARDLNELPQLGEALRQRGKEPDSARLRRGLEVPADDEQDGEAMARRGPARMAVGALWVLLAVVGSIYRVCAG